MLIERGLIDLAGTFAVAVIDSRGQPEDLTLTQYLFDAVHRNAPRFVDQEPGTAYRYRSSIRRTQIDLTAIAGG